MGHAFRICKSELVLARSERRNYVTLMRHMSRCVATMTFVAEHTLRIGEKTPVTAEQVCRALALLRRAWLAHARDR